MADQQHPDPDVQNAIDKLCGALTTYERRSGRESLLILREQDDFVFRAISGKPLDSSLDDMNDEQLREALRRRAE